MTGLYRSMGNYLNGIGGINRNCALLFLGTSLNGVSQGIFIVILNLYILSMGITPDVLGGILSAGPFAQALGSIPMGFMMEKIGFKKVFLIIYSINGLARLIQVSSPSILIISISAFVSGLALAGDFVVRLPFLTANSSPEQRAHIYSLNSILFSISLATGSLIAGFAPALIQSLFNINLTLTYRYILYFGGLLSLVTVLPCLWIAEQPIIRNHKISLSPYLWEMDRFTMHQAIVSLFVGISFGLLFPFMNIYYIYHLGATREFFGTVSALVIIPAVLATTLGPSLSKYFGSVRLVTLLRSLLPLFVVTLALTFNPWVGTVGYWGANALATMTQPISFAFAMQVAHPRAKSAASAWLNVTYWLGNAFSAPIAGAFLALENYRAPLFIAAGSILFAALFNDIFFYRIEASMRAQEN